MARSGLGQLMPALGHILYLGVVAAMYAEKGSPLHRSIDSIHPLPCHEETFLI